MERKIQRLNREKDDDTEFFSAKIRQLKRQVSEANTTRQESEDLVRKLEGQKSRLENFFKTKLGINSMSTLGGEPALTATGNTGDLFSEINFMMRRLEFLEE